MHADHLRRPPRGRRQPGDRDRAGVGGQDGPGRADAVELGEHRQLGVEPLGHRFHHQVSVREGGEIARRPQPRQRLVARLGGELALLDQTPQPLGDLGHAPAQRLRRGVGKHHLVAALRRDLGDAMPHGAGAHHADGGDLNVCRSFRSRRNRGGCRRISLGGALRHRVALARLSPRGWLTSLRDRAATVKARSPGRTRPRGVRTSSTAWRRCR